MNEGTKRAIAKYKREKLTRISFRLHKVNDADILAQLDRQDNRSRYLKGLIRSDMEKIIEKN